MKVLEIYPGFRIRFSLFYCFIEVSVRGWWMGGSFGRSRRVRREEKRPLLNRVKLGSTWKEALNVDSDAQPLKKAGRGSCSELYSDKMVKHVRTQK